MSKTTSRSVRWADACSRASFALGELEEIRQEYEDWRDNLPENLSGSVPGEKLDAVVDLDIQSAIDAVEEAESLDLPQGFGRD